MVSLAPVSVIRLNAHRMRSVRDSGHVRHYPEKRGVNSLPCLIASYAHGMSSGYQALFSPYRVPGNKASEVHSNSIHLCFYSTCRPAGESLTCLFNPPPLPLFTHTCTHTHTYTKTLSWNFPVALPESETLKVAVYDHEHVGSNR